MAEARHPHIKSDGTNTDRQVALAIIKLQQEITKLRAGGDGGGEPPTPPPAPVNVSAPVVSGTTTVGSTLHASTGVWTNSPTSYSYTWYRGDVATGSSSSYVLRSADAGFQMSCTVQASNSGGGSPVVSSVRTATVTEVAPPVVVAPVLVTAPSISGSSVLTTTSGSWSNTPTSYSYQWKRNGINIAGATNQTYTTIPSDIGTNISSTVTAANSAGSAVANSSNVITPTSVPTLVTAPVISGSLPTGNVLSSTTGTWNYSPTSYTYQWKRSGTNITGATNSTYTTAVGDAGIGISCAVTARNATGASNPSTSNILTPTTVVWWALPIRSGRAWASGTAYWINRSSTTVTVPQAFTDEEHDVALIDAAGGASKGGQSTPGGTNANASTWDRLIGGAVGGPLVSDNTQLDWRPSIAFGMGAAVDWLSRAPVPADGKGWLFWGMDTIPETEKTTATNSHIWQDILDGDHDDKYMKLGERLVQKMSAAGIPLKRLLVDANHEMNQSNTYQIYANSYVKYKAAMEHTIDKIREGAGVGNYIRFIHRPAYRNEKPGGGGYLKFADYLDYVPSNVDVLGLSMHPNNLVNSDANITKLFAGTLNSEWYGTDELFDAAATLGKPVAFTEWSPKNEADDACPIADTFITRWYNDVLVPNASIIVCDCIFNQAMRDPDAYFGSTQSGKDHWAAMVTKRKTLWSGLKN